MRLKEMMDVVETSIKAKEIEIKERKNKINSNYTLAKLDFVVIENVEDSLKTYTKIFEELKKLQERIIERNRK